jgi:hypothetical protein
VVGVGVLSFLYTYNFCRPYPDYTSSRVTCVRLNSLFLLFNLHFSLMHTPQTLTNLVHRATVYLNTRPHTSSQKLSSTQPAQPKPSLPPLSHFSSPPPTTVPSPTASKHPSPQSSPQPSSSRTLTSPPTSRSKMRFPTAQACPGTNSAMAAKTSMDIYGARRT